jgi:hypothetical protein
MENDHFENCDEFVSALHPLLAAIFEYVQILYIYLNICVFMHVRKRSVFANFGLQYRQLDGWD